VSEPQKLGKYLIQGVLGKGAMGVGLQGVRPEHRAYGCDQDRTHGSRRSRAHDSVHRPLQERRHGPRAGCTTTNIIGIYEYGEDENVAFIAMEYVEGTGLRAHLDRKTHFDFPHVVAILSQLLLALDVAHERGVIHRDIKPANVILTPGGQVKVADFGHRAHRRREPDADRHGARHAVVHVAGTMPGTRGDHRSDLFSAASFSTSSSSATTLHGLAGNDRVQDLQ
jgi:serine/threonine-protein kinase